MLARRYAQVLRCWTRREIVHAGGTRAMYRGVSAQFAGCGPAHALYFSTYEGGKHLLTGGKNGNFPVEHAAAGAAATVCHDGLMTPFDVVKQRMQLGTRNFSGFVSCMRAIHAEEGASVFFASLQTTVRLLRHFHVSCVRAPSTSVLS